MHVMARAASSAAAASAPMEAAARVPSAVDPLSIVAVRADHDRDVAEMAVQHALRGWVMCATDEDAAAIMRGSHSGVNCITQTGNQHYRDRVVGGYREGRRSVVKLKFDQRGADTRAEAARKERDAARRSLAAARARSDEQESAAARAAAAAAALRDLLEAQKTARGSMRRRRRRCGLHADALNERNA
jgi:hypothetical protein